MTDSGEAAGGTNPEPGGANPEPGGATPPDGATAEPDGATAEPAEPGGATREPDGATREPDGAFPEPGGAKPTRARGAAGGHPPGGSSKGEAAYDGALRLLRRLSPLVTSRIGSFVFDENAKIPAGVRGRRDAAAALLGWARARREPVRPLVWFHAPSVGEGLQARAVMNALLELRPDVELVYTFFSPSARPLAARMPARVAAYLPWDTRDEMDPVLDALRPSLVVFTKTEVWPGLAAAATERGVPLALAAATLPSGAARLRWPGRYFLRPAFSRLARVGAISEEDGVRFARLGVPPGRVRVTGDPGIDSAAERAGEADPSASYLAPFGVTRVAALGAAGEAGSDGSPGSATTTASAGDPGSAAQTDESAAAGPLHGAPEEPGTSSRPALVAGSTWPADEAVLIPAFLAARASRPDLRLILAPHEPDPDHLAVLSTRLAAEGVRVRLLADVEAGADVGDADAVLVDRVGVLAHLYHAGTVAYVGGGFHRHGLHSVLEPAAAGVPVTFGPRHGNARAAGDLLSAGGARVTRSAQELAGVVLEWLDDESARARASGAAFAYISRHRGASDRSARMLSDLIETDGGRD